MNIFISWSGVASRHLAEKLSKWLKLLPIDNIETWVSGDAIDPGTRWNKELGQALDETDFGILILTKSNQLAPWVCYEAGALSKSFERSWVVPYLLDFTIADLEQPIKQFQALRSDKDGTWKLVKHLYEFDTNSSRTESDVRAAFETLWVILESNIKEAHSLLEGDINKTQALDIPEQLKKITILLESLSSRIFRLENRGMINNVVNSTKGDFHPPEYRKELALINQKLDKLSRLDEVGEFIRQADFLINTNPQQAIIIYDKAIDRDPNNEPALIGKAKAYRKMKRWDDAISILDDVISHNVDAERAYYNRACYKNLSRAFDIGEVTADLMLAIKLFGKYRQYAMEDPDFTDIKDSEEFKKICFESEE